MARLLMTYPGMPEGSPAALVFEVINTDINHRAEGVLSCAGEGLTYDPYHDAYAGAQYQYSPKVVFDWGPSQYSVTVFFNADSEGDKGVTCTLRYISFKEEGEARLYLTKDGKHIEVPEDEDYEILLIEATVPFVTGMNQPACPDEKPLCTAAEVYDAEPDKFPVLVYIIPAAIIVIVAAVVAIRRKR